MRNWIVLGVLLAACGSPVRAELMLFARYDWQDGAKDVSGSPIRHDGVLDPGASIENGKLVVNGWAGVQIGHLPELGGATSVVLRFEDVTFTKHGEEGSGASSNFAVLTGDNMNWWAAVRFDLPPDQGRTTLVFDLGGFDYGPELVAVVADDVVDHFDSIEYRFDGLAPAGQRLAIRWNDGPWVIGGEGNEALHEFPPDLDVRVNNGLSGDWNPMWGSLGPVSFYSNQVPEPAAGGLLVGAAFACPLSRRINRGKMHL